MYKSIELSSHDHKFHKCWTAWRIVQVTVWLFSLLMLLRAWKKREIQSNLGFDRLGIKTRQMLLRACNKIHSQLKIIHSEAKHLMGHNVDVMNINYRRNARCFIGVVMDSNVMLWQCQYQCHSHSQWHVKVLSNIWSHILINNTFFANFSSHTCSMSDFWG